MDNVIVPPRYVDDSIFSSGPLWSVWLGDTRTWTLRKRVNGVINRTLSVKDVSMHLNGSRIHPVTVQDRVGDGIQLDGIIDESSPKREFLQ